MGYELERLNQAHLHMVELALAGFTRDQIAVKLGRSPVGVGLIINSPAFQKEISRRRNQQNRRTDEAVGTYLSKAEKIIDESSIKAAETLRALMSSNDEKIKLASSKSILESIYSRQKLQASNGGGSASVVVITPQGLDLLRRALEEDPAEQSSTIDDSFVDGELVATGDGQNESGA